MATELLAQQRAHKGSAASNRLRKQDILPAVMYGKDAENKNLQVNVRDVEKILRTKLGTNSFINLKVEGDKDYSVLIKDYQGHAITRKLKHIDFWQVGADQEVEVSVETKLSGKAPGLLYGGILEHISHNVKLLCKAGQIPEELVVDVSGLDLNQNIHLNDLTMPEGVRYRDNYNPTIVSMVEEKQQAAEEVAVAAEAPAEGEKAEGGAEDKAAEGAKEEDKGEKK